MDLMYCSVSKM